jgi:hypothetical protein
MQSQLTDVTIGTRNGIVVEATLLDTANKSIPINKFKFKENGFLGLTLKVLQNVPDGYILNILLIDTKSSTHKNIDFIFDSTNEFGVYVLSEKADCLVVSGRFKPSHNCRKL